MAKRLMRETSMPIKDHRITRWLRQPGRFSAGLSQTQSDAPGKFNVVRIGDKYKRCGT
ncbi:MAG: hypothetical protein ACP5I8_08485 [Phycisphaerae bacterium]